MADGHAHLFQTPQLPPPPADDENFSDVLPLMGLSRRTTEVSLHETDSNDNGPTSQLEISTASSAASSETDSRVSTAVPTTPTISQRWIPSWFLHLVEGFSHAVDLRVRRSRFHGWRMGVLLGCCMSFFVLCCNVALIVIGAVSKDGYDPEGIATLIEGDETLVTKWNTAFHVIINALSTALLSTSNYTMQVLSSPTRKDINTAHAKGQWLDIGLLSTRNLRAIPRNRAALWLTLSLSSIPLHLFYNASVFKVVTARNGYNITTMDIASKEWQHISNRTDNNTWSEGEYRNLSPSHWNEVYSKAIASVHGDLYLAIDRISFNTTLFSLNGTLSRSGNNLTKAAPEFLNTIAKSDPSTPGKIIIESPNWIYFDLAYDGGLVNNITADSSSDISVHIAQAVSKKEPGYPSTVRISLYFLIVVVAFNFFKLMILLLVLITDRSAYLVTLGDAASSFLKREDLYTKNRCLLGREEMLSSMKKSIDNQYYSEDEAAALRSRLMGLWVPRSRPYLYKFGPPYQRFKFFSFCSFVFVVIAVATIPLNYNLHPSWNWGAASTFYLYESRSDSAVATLWSAWLANVPQLLLSFCYFVINLQFTSMAGAAEWNRLGTSRKGLRVTQPYGHQRSTYFLQLPYRWSLPLILVSGTTHWLMSQTFFLVRIDTLFMHEGTQRSTSACGFSVVSMIVLLSVFAVLLFALVVVGSKKMQPKIPIVSSCSLAISAACHPAPDEVDPHLAKVQWGVIEKAVTGGLGHCSLSSKSVAEPEVMQAYH